MNVTIKGLCLLAKALQGNIQGLNTDVATKSSQKQTFTRLSHLRNTYMYGYTCQTPLVLEGFTQFK